jgi:hypothetical protein
MFWARLRRTRNAFWLIMLSSFDCAEAARAWRDPHSYVNAELTRPGWAWEFLRRHPVFRRVWHQARSTFEQHRLGTHQRIIVAHGCSAEDWSCLYSDPPCTEAQAAAVLWDPDRYGRVLHVRTYQGGTRPNSRAFDLAAIACPHVLLRSEDGREHLLFYEQGRSLQLAISGVSVRHPVHLVAEAALPSTDVNSQLWAMRCFDGLLVSGRLLPNYFPIENRSARLRTVLQALDGWLAGAPPREIALACYGARRVETSWNDPGNHLRDSLRRTIQRGRELMNGGYLQFLR